MKKNIIRLFLIVLVIIGGVYLFGFYPVARVNDQFLLYRTYDERAIALERFETKKKLAGATTPIPSAGDGAITRQAVLENMIWDAVFRAYSASHAEFANVEADARTAVDTALKSADPTVLPQATKELFGWSVEKFSQELLLPEAFRNAFAQAAAKNGISLEELSKIELSQARVSLYGVPWKWENGALVEK